MINKIRKQLAYLRQRQHAALQDEPEILFQNPSNELEQDEPWPRFKFNIRWDDIGGKNKHYT